MANTTYETVQTGCSGVSGSGANIIFIEKRISFPASLQHTSHVAVSQSDIQCFSHEDGCFEPVKRTPRAACLNYNRCISFESHVSGSAEYSLTSNAHRANPADTGRPLRGRAHSGSHDGLPQSNAAARPKVRPSSDYCMRS